MNSLYKETREKDPNYFNCECPVCKKKFHVKQFHKNRFKEHFCSKECQNIALASKFFGENNPQYGLKGSLNASWKSDEKINSYGYRLVRSFLHPFANCDGFVFEHRLVAEKYLLNDENSIEIDGKKYLRKDYDVHHKDQNKTNNDVSNLVVISKSDHKKLHNNLNPRKRDPVTGRFISS